MMSSAEERAREAEERARARLERAQEATLSRAERSPLWVELRKRLDRTRAEFEQRLGVESEAQAPSAAPLDRVFLEQALSELKHGVVESCFYNLRLLAQKALLDGGEDDGESLARSLERLRGVADELDGFFQQPTPSGPTVGEFLPDCASDLTAAVTELLQVAAAGAVDLPQIPPMVDHALDVLSAAAADLRQHRVSLQQVVEEAVGLEGPRLTEAAMKVVIDPLAEEDRIHADRGAVLGAIIELLRNAAVHRAESGPGEVGVGLVVQDRALVLTVWSRPSLSPPAPFEALFDAGTTRKECTGGDGLCAVRKVVSQHGGSARLEFEDREKVFRVLLEFPLGLPE